MTTAQPSRSPRRDTARNRGRIVDAARAALAADRPLQFNEIARSAEVGVGTVYRHFSSSEALREAAVLDRLQNLLYDTTDLDDGTDPWVALADFLRLAFAAQRDEPSLTEVIVQSTDSLEGTASVRAALGAVFTRRLTAAADSGQLRAGLTAVDVTALLCGTAYAVRAGRPVLDDLYLDILLAGLRAPR